MNFDIPFIPERTSPPRESGLTMMMDKGLSQKEAEHFCESSADFTDQKTCMKRSESIAKQGWNLILEERCLRCSR